MALSGLRLSQIPPDTRNETANLIRGAPVEPDLCGSPFFDLQLTMMP
jgi:hypothetical protein